jgi:hypothetical protein
VEIFILLFYGCAIKILSNNTGLQKKNVFFSLISSIFRRVKRAESRSGDRIALSHPVFEFSRFKLKIRFGDKQECMFSF